MKAILLDRDGVINKERGEYTFRISDFSFVEGVVDAIVEWTNRGYQIAIITNQGGIAKGLYDHQDVEILHDHIISEIKKVGGKIDKVFYCPHHQDYGRCLCRKPESLMIERALHQLGAIPKNAVMIGDSERDVQAAEKVGVKGIKIEPNHLPTNIIQLIDEYFYHS